MLRVLGTVPLRATIPMLSVPTMTAKPGAKSTSLLIIVSKAINTMVSSCTFVRPSPARFPRLTREATAADLASTKIPMSLPPLNLVLNITYYICTLVLAPQIDLPGLISYTSSFEVRITSRNAQQQLSLNATFDKSPDLYPSISHLNRLLCSSAYMSAIYRTLLMSSGTYRASDSQERFRKRKS